MDNIVSPNVCKHEALLAREHYEHCVKNQTFEATPATAI
jgi:hypothetical protein